MGNRYPARCRNSRLTSDELRRRYGERYDYSSEASSYESESSQTSESTDSLSASDDLPENSPPKISDSPSANELRNFLEEYCPEEYATIRQRNTLNFENWNAPPSRSGASSSRVRIGIMGTPFDSTRHIVYAYIFGDDQNRIGLSYGIQNKLLNLVDAKKIELDRLFRCLCLDGRIFMEEEKKRFRALLCFFYLDVGHITGFKKYRDFEKGLVDACTWLGQATLKIAQSEPGIDDGIVSRQIGEDAKPGSTLQKPQAPHLKPAGLEKRNRSVGENHDLENKGLPPPKRTKVQDTVTAMRRRHDEQGAEISALENQLAESENTTRFEAVLKKKIAEQDARIAEQDKKIEELTSKSLRQSTVLSSQNDRLLLERGSLLTDLQKSREIAEMESLGREKEQELRLGVEKRLKEYVDAQKKIVAQFA